MLVNHAKRGLCIALGKVVGAMGGVMDGSFQYDSHMLQSVLDWFAAAIAQTHGTWLAARDG